MTVGYKNQGDKNLLSKTLAFASRVCSQKVTVYSSLQLIWLHTVYHVCNIRTSTCVFIGS